MLEHCTLLKAKQKVLLWETMCYKKCATMLIQMYEAGLVHTQKSSCTVVWTILVTINEYAIQICFRNCVCSNCIEPIFLLVLDRIFIVV